MLRLLVCCVMIAAAYAATTVPPTRTTATILYDMKHHKAMIVRADGCYEYHMNHQDGLDAENAATKPILEARMLAELATAINIQEMGHHHIDHMTQDIVTACAAIPVFSWDIPQAVVTTILP